MIDNLLGSLSEDADSGTAKEESAAPPRKAKTEPLRRDLLAEDYIQKYPNIYESVIVMSQRARQIGQKQARVIESIISLKNRSDEDEDEDIVVKSLEDDDDDTPKLPKFEKPTVVAMNEMYRGDLKYKYRE